ncbi:unnamed protein product [Ilex paraguariensis]|uniref:Uncharacterized protein n=1 Tax=Ilex paraguariensis TaxID=185542 RepID=A0ABC8T319_9AQUA
MAMENDNTVVSESYSRYMIVRPENGGIFDLLRFWVSADKRGAAKFIESSDYGVLAEELGGGDVTAPDHRWVIFVSIIVRKILSLSGKPMKWIGYLIEFVLNLFSLNGNLLGLLCNLLHGKVVMPQRGSETFISLIGHIDGRIDLSRTGSEEDTDETSFGERSMKAEIGNWPLMDLCMMAAKLSYENAKVVENVVNHHWKACPFYHCSMHFVEFYNCWNGTKILHACV